MEKNLRIIYMGTPEFAVPALELLVNHNWNVVAVITAPDKPKGRGQKIIPSPVKEAAERHNIPVLQPTNLKAPEFIAELKGYKADIQVVVAFRMLPEVVWDMPPQGTFNLHASLLPDYRGAAPINRAIINGEVETGVTTFFLKHEIDTGSIIFQEKEPVYPDDNAGSLYERLMEKGAKLVLKTIEAVSQNEVTLSLQDESRFIHHAPKIFKETCEINWSKSAEEIHNLVRGLAPYPAAYTSIQDKVCKIFKTKPDNDNSINLKTGEFITDGNDRLIFQTGKGTLEILEFQMEGKRRMAVGEYLRGNQL